MDSVEVEFDRLLEQLNRNKLETEQFKKFILEKNAAIKVMSNCLVDMVRKIATIEIGKGFLAISDWELLSSARWKAAK